MSKMKILISVDIEGVAGICSWDETTLGNDTYRYFQQEMTNEVKVCAKTLLQLGITDIYVRDAHDSARNIIPNILPPEVKLIRNWSGAPCDMMDGLDDSFDGVIFIGYHSPARSSGNPLSHTLTTSLNHIKINGKIVSEFLINTYYAKTLNVPVIMVVGDENLTKIVQAENNLIVTVATNQGLNGAVIAKHPSLVADEIKNATINAIENLTKQRNSLFVSMPKIFDTEIHFRTHQKAYRATFYPNAYRINDDKTGFKSNNFQDVLKFIMFTS